MSGDGLGAYALSTPGSVTGAAAAEGLGHVHGEEPEAAELPEDVRREALLRVDGGRLRHDDAGREVPRGLLNEALGFGQAEVHAKLLRARS